MRDRLPYRRPVPVSQVPPADLGDLAATVRAAHQGVMLAVTNMIEHALAAGDALIAAKAALEADVGYGHWLAWLKKECDLSEDRAERYMLLARNRAIVEADSARVRNLSLTGAFKLLGKPAKGSKSQPESEKPTKAAASFDTALSWWNGASREERRRFIGEIGSRPLATAIPPAWNTMLMPAGAIDRIARLHKKVADLEARLNERNHQLANLQRQTGRVFGVAPLDQNGAAVDGDGLDSPARLRRSPAGASFVANGAPPAIVTKSSNGGLLREE
jgi:hypothetical protein